MIGNLVRASTKISTFVSNNNFLVFSADNDYVSLKYHPNMCC